jgi:hypothetical protein
VDTPAVAEAGPRRLVVVGYLVTLPDGYECRLGPDETRARLYAARNHSGKVEPMYVLRWPAEAPAAVGNAAREGA